MICMASALLTSCAAVPVSGYLSESNDGTVDGTVVTGETQTNSTDSNHTQTESVQEEAQTEAETEPNSAMYAAYAQIIEDYEQECGEGAYVHDIYQGGYILSGVYLAQLLDFDGDGQEELLLAIHNEDTSYGQEVFAVVWAYIDGEATLVYSPEIQTEEGYWNDWRESGYIYTNVICTNSNNLFVGYTTYNGKIYMMQGLYEDNSYYYFEFLNGTFQRVRTVSTPTSKDDAYRIDGDAVSAAEWVEQQDPWKMGTEYYNYQSTVLGNVVKTVGTVEETKAVLNGGA